VKGELRGSIGHEIRLIAITIHNYDRYSVRAKCSFSGVWGKRGEGGMRSGFSVGREGG
jgi:hypothetical protein